ncbi:MAG: hypothetical protein ACP5N1_06135 [Candidatus Woesearchaeota archaeon]
MISTKILKPLNNIEKKILNDKEFLNAIKTGKSRPYHLEGTIKNHIIHILNYIEDNYKSTKEYENLRIIAMLHDIGKFAFLEKYLDNYMPKMNKNERNKFIASSKLFAKKYSIPKNITVTMKQYEYTSEHAYVSYLFAKKFLKNTEILNIIRYHDIALDFMKIHSQTGKYDVVKFKTMFSNLNLNLYLKFVDCDKLGRKDIVFWLKKELKKHAIAV